MEFDHSAYRGAVKDITERFKTMSEMDKYGYAYAYDTFYMYAGRIGRGGGALAPFRPLTEADHCEHVFSNNERLFLVQEAIDKLDDVVAHGTTLRVGRKVKKILPVVQQIAGMIDKTPSGHPIFLNRDTSEAIYTSLIATVLKYPHTMPAMRAMLKVAALGGITVASDTIIELADVCSEHIDPNGAKQAMTGMAIYNLEMSKIKMGYLFDMMRQIKVSNGAIFPGFRDTITKYAKDQRCPELTGVVTTMESMMNDLGPEAARMFPPDLFGYLSTHDAIPAINAMFKDADPQIRSNGLRYLKFLLDLAVISLAKPNRFRNTPKGASYEAVCLGRKVVRTIYTDISQLFYTSVVDAIERKKPARFIDMANDTHKLKIDNTEKLDDFFVNISFHVTDPYQSGRSTEALCIAAAQETARNQTFGLVDKALHNILG